MVLPRDSRWRLGPALCFLVLLVLAGFASLTDSTATRNLLRVLIPAAGVALAAYLAAEATSKPDYAASALLGVGCLAGVGLELFAGGAFSNVVVDAAIIAGCFGTRRHRA